MNKIILIVFLVFTFFYTNLNAVSFTKKDLQVLKDLDIEKSFVHDEHLQDLYDKLSDKNHIHVYKRNLRESSIYISKIKEVLNQEGLPSSFLFLSMAESNFRIDAKSSTNALGLWQFMPTTARIHKLRNDEYVDERLDFIKSTHAASKYLKSHHKRFDKWYLAILAYNCGEGRVIEAITRASIDKYIQLYPNKKNSKRITEYRNTIKEYLSTRKDFYKVNRIYKDIRQWNIPITARDLLKIQEKVDRQYLPSESRSYLRKIVILAMIANRNFLKKGYIFDRDINATITTVKVKGGLHLRSISKVLNMKHNTLAKMNIHIKQEIVPFDVKRYDLNIPYSKLGIYNKNKNKIKNDSFVIYRVKKGDTLSGIAHKYKVKYGLIKKFNDLKSNKLSLKQKLVIPVDKYKVNKKTRKSTKKIIYKVKKGDSLSTIAHKFKLNIKKIKRDNNLKSNKIKVGDKIAIYK
ncbi:LysM peptidoglycan-binding domain-containing protein [Poseidonibacter lekithochrous]|uniref:lytic transglycosylase domain-containing protein n=1 Tax=Poseidonibacter TaxID=2321187 RepID=UPI001C09C344|nr:MULTISPECIES: lytic transglycosylase domain-containing protein [Poseidonibacter]MBU3013625.1 LysM peptidoglycan-binding domain-containing protein [Poseidonibacter lekithochrous]MDO6826922.1 LysM peptidoglycan-binding domain-containing protein [Poseidonibacter sp. 1_MG-2023]